MHFQALTEMQFTDVGDKQTPKLQNQGILVLLMLYFVFHLFLDVDVFPCKCILDVNPGCRLSRQSLSKLADTQA